MSADGPGWVPGAAGSGFGPDHLPYGVFVRPGQQPRAGVRVGGWVLDLATATATGLPEVAHLFSRGSLDAFLAAGRPTWRAVRRWLVDLLGRESAPEGVERHLVDLAEVTLLLPFTVGDYVDFYASEHHAANVGRILRPGQEPLLPNWRHLPVGYHGRSGTVVVSGTEVVRPHGQSRAPGDAAPVFAPTQRLDLEAELGFVVGTGTALGERVPTGALADHVFGVVGLNDWSARDIQAWEYVPLGPFLGKSFATSVSAWVTPLEALEAAWVELPGQDPEPLAYLRTAGPAGLDVEMEVAVNGHVVTRPSYRSMYWAPAQMLAHLSANGASVRPGDLFASGTVSGPDPGQQGSLLELSQGWRRPFAVGDGRRTALEDGDEVVLRYSAPAAGGGRLTLGEVTGRVLPAR